jgi:5'-nucleotidase
MGHTTINNTLYLSKISKEGDAITEYSCSFRNASRCVKIAVNEILESKTRFMCIRNHGSNSSINVIYSGTMSAAVAGIEGIPAIGFRY